MQYKKSISSNLLIKDTSFANLMQSRIYNVLLLASNYDTFMLEDDGRIDEKIFLEYSQLNLRYSPRFTQVSTEMAALKELMIRHYDLIITMSSNDKSHIFEIAGRIKKIHPEKPIVALTPFSRKVYEEMEQYDLSAIDYIFSWLGNTDLLLAIIKLIEDWMNIENDVNSVGVQVILLIEDSVRFYSSFLPHLYKFILKQSQIFSTEALNEHQRMLRMRGRPKIVLSRSYEEAKEIYDKYKKNILGIISDVRFPKDDENCADAGFEFCEYVRKQDAFVPIIVQSYESENEKKAAKYNADYLDKNSKKLPIDLRETILRKFGFGDFVFIDPKTGKEIASVHSLKELQDSIFSIPDDSLFYHCTRNHISRWLYSRAMFPLAEFVRKKSFDDISQASEIRQLVFDAIVQYRKMKNRGIVAEFNRVQFDRYSNFARIGQGSMGGKGRGLAFIDTIIKRNQNLDSFDNAMITIPKTLVLCTDIFDEFMDNNLLYQVGLSDIADEEILKYFLKGKLKNELIDDFLAFFEVVKSPIAIRSSSLLEDSHYQPFAGIYSTYMIPYLDDKYEMLRLVSDAIKGVYASVFYKGSKAYMNATSNVIDQEKMAIIIQEVVGNEYNEHFYPSFSGVARSLNYYPINNESTEEGIANIAIGLGKYIVDGGITLRFSPYWPSNVLQTSTLDLALKDTQTRFYALDMRSLNDEITVDDGANLLKLSIRDAETDNSIRKMVSTYDPRDMMIHDGYYPGGRKVVTFSNILNGDTFPLPDILKEVLKTGSKEMGRPIEIEFAVNLDDKNGVPTLYWLQIRPIVESKELSEEDISKVKPEESVIYSKHAIGHGKITDVNHIVYIKTDNFTSSKNPQIAREVEYINDEFILQKKNYVLVGPGRWGSEDYFLGIPVKWPHISQAKVIVESSLQNYRIEPSQGTHFFQNMTSFGVGYFSISPERNDGVFDRELLDSMPAVMESDFVRVVKFDEQLDIKINATKGIGFIKTNTNEEKPESV